MKRNNKKGFTIVELVIVIAVIAILAAVLIPTISSVVTKAKMSADTQLVRNLNTALQIDEAENGKPTSFEVALNVILESGYIVEKLNPTAEGNFYAWDETTNQMLYLDKEFNVIFPQGVTGAITDNKWHVAVSDLFVYVDVLKMTPKTYFLGESISKNTTFDLTGVTVASLDVNLVTAIVVEDGTVSIKGGIINSFGNRINGDGNLVQNPIQAIGNATLNIEDTTFDMLNTAKPEIGLAGNTVANLKNVTINTAYVGLNVAHNAVVTLEDCTINAYSRAVWCTRYSSLSGNLDSTHSTGSVKTIIKSGTYTILNQPAASENNVSTIAAYSGAIEVKGGTFANQKNGVLFNVAHNNGVITITGGSFVIDGTTYTFEQYLAGLQNNEEKFTKTVVGTTSIANNTITIKI